MVSFPPSDLVNRMLPDSIETVTYDFEVGPEYVDDLKSKLKTVDFDDRSLTRRDGRVLSPPDGEVVSCSSWEFNFWDPPNSIAIAPEFSVRIVFKLSPT